MANSETEKGYWTNLKKAGALGLIGGLLIHSAPLAIAGGALIALG